MPNHCFNKLYMDGPGFRITIKKFLSCSEGQIERKCLDFNKIIQMPEELNVISSFGNIEDELKSVYEHNIKNYGFKTWYEWCVHNWGTKWNSYNCTLDKKYIAFDTAWSPPIPVIVQLSALTQKTFILEYYEAGMDFAGSMTASNGIIVEDDFYENSDLAPKKLKKSLGIEPPIID